jgi:hypothetical protein
MALEQCVLVPVAESTTTFVTSWNCFKKRRLRPKI